ncbi:hypothetical protein MAV_3821 [Mycobacterium avium 104]|uniref:Uncharacterized protein n=1 Tax=Mycobacterium avium (strain 104) TaxID=243243 RepID=A0A0H2ZY17_MYCA1|nr:hypothetical protein MAV_3821 [Mycobacterium avium 104]
MHRGTGLRGRPPPRRRGPRGSRCSRAGAALADVGLPAHRRRAIDRLATDGETAQGRHHRVGRRHSAQPQNPPVVRPPESHAGFRRGLDRRCFRRAQPPRALPSNCRYLLPSLIRSSARAGTAGKKTSAQPARLPRLVQAATAPTIGGAAILTTARAGNLAASRYCDRLHVGGGHGSSAQ